MLRATPNLYVFRPGDAVEVAESWEAALTITDAPSVLSLSRQATPTLRRESSTLNKSIKGGYVLIEPSTKRDITIIATGTELALAVEAAEKLKMDQGVQAAVVSMPCQELFNQQDQKYQEIVLGFGPKMAVEAASGFGWERYTSGTDAFVGMTGFGESAPASELYQHFGITVEAVVAKALDVIS
jgi:transketolase